VSVTDARRSRTRRVAAVVVGTLIAMLAVGGCTGVPTTSAPQTVQPIGVGEAAPPVAPRRGAGPREIVDDFLKANATDPVKHSSAREFLTSSARNRWADLTATIVSDLRVGTYNAKTHTLPVSGRIVGSLDNRGIYTPSLNGTGHGGVKVPFSFGLGTVRGQYRINALRNGLLITEDQFRTNYQQRVLYFYDNAQHYLVPDVRYSALNDAVELSDWLLGQLVAGPSPGLQNVVSTETLPAQARRVSAKINAAQTTVQIPGSRQLSADVRNRLAAQVSVTLTKAVHIGQITIVDGDAAVVIPRASGTRFSESDFSDAEGPTPPTQEVYYLSDGRVRRATGSALRGPVGNGSFLFDSVALARPTSIGTLTIAGVQGTGDQQRLFIGTQDGGMHPTTVSGQLTRPAWAPGRPEVWIGQGSKVIQLMTNGRTSTAVTVSIPSAAGGGRVVALRLSPDGARVAFVIAGANGLPQLYVGPIVRSGKTVQVDALQQVSPDDIVIQDVAWVDSLKLYAIGYVRSTQEAGVFECGIDGSEWDDLGISTLPKAPTTITATTDAAAWVSADGFVWEQNGSNWVSPGSAATGQTPGDKPIYLG
jgi:hypothetical protein